MGNDQSLSNLCTKYPVYLFDSAYVYNVPDTCKLKSCYIRTYHSLLDFLFVGGTSSSQIMRMDYCPFQILEPLPFLSFPFYNI